MKYGYCTGFSTEPRFGLGLEFLDMIREAGFDYVEFPLMNFYEMPESEFSSVVEKTEKSDIKSLAACNFFPADIKLVGKGIDVNKTASYLDSILPRLKRLGILKIILGSGPSRTFGPEQTRKEAFDQFVGILKDVILPRTKRAGMLVCIEPFDKTCCNLIVSASEGLELVRTVHDDGLEMMVDLFHMMSNGESLDSLKSCVDHVRHVHIAGFNRRIPEESDEYVFNALNILFKLGYEETVSFETEKPKTWKDASRALSKIKNLFGR
ncbi:sugar phosphate isomerase/epimerase [Treponema parvum]|uniref:Sugar phosphate isomerase/epimerase n=1 Tax=Treponema parvum TaxID=138851 RepID=A0A975IEC4_9SPIR|nr:TIM barrel protein [Treponema parvum]QTQ13139.1 sugar phosphate isomerase/epimerase [Treponema parvum]